MYKIKKIEFFNDEIFGNSVLDFTIGGKPASTIVIAGKNGIGKTKLLTFLYNVFNQIIPLSLDLNNDISAEIIVDIKDYNYKYQGLPVDEVIIFCKRIGEEYRLSAEYLSNGEWIIDKKKEISLKDKMQSFSMKALLSPVDITYNPNREVNTVSNKKLDEIDTSIPRDLANEIIQLLVDIKMQDNNDIVEYLEGHSNVPKNKKNIRMNRFNKAFFHIFNRNLRLKGLKENVMPIFQKGDKEIKITELSSGEKQIVFRGTYLLKNQEALKGCLVLVDEPEISMHPSWNKNIYDFYRRLFKTDKGDFTSQLIMATHSEYVIESALNDDNCVIIKLDSKRNNKYNKYLNNTLFEKSTSAEIKYNIFDISSIDYHIQLFSYIQNNYVGDDSSIKDVDSFLMKNSSPEKEYSYVDKSGNNREYKSLCTYIRNCIDHPDHNHKYTNEELNQSIKFMIKIIKEKKLNKLLLLL